MGGCAFLPDILFGDVQMVLYALNGETTLNVHLVNVPTDSSWKRKVIVNNGISTEDVWFEKAHASGNEQVRHYRSSAYDVTITWTPRRTTGWVSSDDIAR